MVVYCKFSINPYRRKTLSKWVNLPYLGRMELVCLTNVCQTTQMSQCVGVPIGILPQTGSPNDASCLLLCLKTCTFCLSKWKDFSLSLADVQCEPYSISTNHRLPARTHSKTAPPPLDVWRQFSGRREWKSIAPETVIRRSNPPGITAGGDHTLHFVILLLFLLGVVFSFCSFYERAKIKRNAPSVRLGSGVGLPLQCWGVDWLWCVCLWAGAFLWRDASNVLFLCVCCAHSALWVFLEKWFWANKPPLRPHKNAIYMWCDAESALNARRYLDAWKTLAHTHTPDIKHSSWANYGTIFLCRKENSSKAKPKQKTSPNYQNDFGIAGAGFGRSFGGWNSFSENAEEIWNSSGTPGRRRLRRLALIEHRAVETKSRITLQEKNHTAACLNQDNRIKIRTYVVRDGKHDDVLGRQRVCVCVFDFANAGTVPSIWGWRVPGWRRRPYNKSKLYAHKLAPICYCYCVWSYNVVIVPMSGRPAGGLSGGVFWNVKLAHGGAVPDGVSSLEPVWISILCPGSNDVLKLLAWQGVWIIRALPVKD